MTASMVGHYRLVRQLGAGGMGAVYEAVDTMVERRVAIKMLREEIARQPDLIERFRVEAVLLAKLNHPCTATLYNFFREGNDYFMVLEFVPGRTLEEVLRQCGRLPVDTAVSILRQTLDGMAHAHEVGVLHRDIKPANIMVTSDGRVKVTDFGIARVLGSSHITRAGRIIGTMEYIAPERLRWEEADIRSDIYSAGVVLYEALTGRLPFTAPTEAALMRAHLEDPPPSLAAGGLPGHPELEEVLLKALAKRAEDRFQSAQEFSRALAIVPTPVMRPTRLAEDVPVVQRRPRRWLPWAAGSAGVLAVVLMGILWRQSLSTPPPAAIPPEPPVVASSTPTQATPVAPQLPLPETAPPASAPVTFDVPPPQTRLPADEALPIVQVPPHPPVTTRLPVEMPKPVAAAPASEEPQVAAPPATAPAAPARPAVRSLGDVKSIFVRKMANDLDIYLKAEISEQLAGRVSLARMEQDADAVLSGSSEELSNTGSRVTGGYLGMKDQARASVSLRSRGDRFELWSSEAGDKSPILGALKRGGAKKVAERLIGNLKKKMGEH